jgi:hypothetical protein
MVHNHIVAMTRAHPASEGDLGDPEEYTVDLAAELVQPEQLAEVPEMPCPNKAELQNRAYTLWRAGHSLLDISIKLDMVWEEDDVMCVPTSHFTVMC